MTLRPSPLLSQDEARRTARPLRGWSEDDQARLADVVQTVLQQWTDAWGLASAEDDAVEMRSSPIEDGFLAAASWSALEASGPEGGILWCLPAGIASASLVAGPPRRHRPALDALHAALFQEAPVAAAGAERLADRLVQSAWADWNRRLADLLPAERAAGPSAREAAALIREPWSGTLVADLPWCGRRMALLFTDGQVSAVLNKRRDRPAAARSTAKASPPLTSLFEVVEAEGVALRVELTKMEVDLGTLAGLRPGDVLRTSHRLDEPLLLTGGDQAERVTRCAGHLGRQQEWRAIELLPYAASSGAGRAS